MKKISWVLGIACALWLTPYTSSAQDSAAAPAPATAPAAAAAADAPAAAAADAPAAAAPAAADADVLNDPGQMLPESAARILGGIQSDPHTDKLVRGSHYWISNENAHYVYYPKIKDMGGVFSGVGSDQVYMLAGWANASLIIPMDFDRAIQYLHFAYGAAFLASETIAEFLTYWNPKNEAKIRAALQQYFPEHLEDAFRSWKKGVHLVRTRFVRIVSKYPKLPSYLQDKAKKNAKMYGKNASIFTEPVPTFLTDEEQYRRIRTLWLNHRVYPVCGDLNGDIAMQEIARALKNAGMKMKIFYLSNAEAYFNYGPKYRRNFLDMPFEEDGILLRTRQQDSLGIAERDDYHYSIHAQGNFKRWMGTTNVKNLGALFLKRSKTEITGLSFFDYEPEASPKAPEIAESTL